MATNTARMTGIGATAQKLTLGSCQYHNPASETSASTHSRYPALMALSDCRTSMAAMIPRSVPHSRKQAPSLPVLWYAHALAPAECRQTVEASRGVSTPHARVRAPHDA